MNKDKAWLKDEVKSLFDKAYNLGKMEYHESEESIHRINSLVDQLDEPQKPVVPQFVADYIEKRKYSGLIMTEWFRIQHSAGNECKVGDWLYDNEDDEVTLRREFTLIDAIRYGYEVEKEKKYYVDLGTAAYVAKWGGDGSVQIYTDSISGSDEYELHLTEKEIKDYDKRYWPFAVKVEGVG